MNVIIVDDDQLVSMSLKTILEATGDITVADIGKNGEEAIKLYEQYKPDILLMDIRMEGMTGLEAGAKIIETHPDAKILFLTTFSDDEYIIKSIHIGAKGYILKQAFETIVPAITAIYNGQTVFGDEIMNRIPTLINRQPHINYEEWNVSKKEFDIIRLVAEGYNNKEIAGELYLSEGTVRNYLSTILEKLNLRDRTQLACFYYKHI
ncbi:MAG: response regulator transcription factor [Lachnospiraceae bacterium]|nr:response regulator transcription factor [Lachnospiraceae bacterium]